MSEQKAVHVVTAPTVEPISLDEAKLFLRVDGSDEDDLISMLIQAVREYGENYTHRAWASQTLMLAMDQFPCDTEEIELPRPPLQSVSSVKYIDVNGVLQTVDSSLYQVDIYTEPGRLKPAYLQHWYINAGTRGDFNSVQITYVAGYAAASETSIAAPTKNIPAAIKHWMKIRLTQLYEHREMIVVGNLVTKIPRDLTDGLLDRYRVRLFG